MTTLIRIVSLAALLTGCMMAGRGTDGRATPATADPRFDWFAYEGRDAVYRGLSVGPNEYLNPILAGFYPDPSITRAGDDYYLVNSTFTYFPGIPIHHSLDLVNWTQIGNVIHRPTQLKFDGLEISRGVFAPTIEYHEATKTFYVLNTCVDCGGNYLVTATNPAGPWSDPVWLPEVGGIDSNIFFDDDGKVYIINNDGPVGKPLYEGHRAIWIRQYDPVAKKTITPQTVLVNGGVDLSKKPIWIEGPHIYKVGGKYYLVCAEGGTAVDHSQVVLRSDNVLGPYVPHTGNPILTQRHLDPARPYPVTSAGHADMVQRPNGEWWSIFLATRPYEGDMYNINRETFLLPVSWKDGWPFITTDPIPYVRAKPPLPVQPAPAIPTHGNFSIREDFDGSELAPYWMMIRSPRERWYDFASSPGWLTIRARPEHLAKRAQPSFIGRRQQHLTFSASTAMRYMPAKPGDVAGLAAFQNDWYYYLLGVTLDDGKPVVRLWRHAGAMADADGAVVASAPLRDVGDGPVYLKVEGDGGRYSFFYGTRPNEWMPIARDEDASILSTHKARGFVGVMLGMYAYSAP
jgi:xylan 1,4-beta-xylosidase